MAKIIAIVTVYYPTKSNIDGITEIALQADYTIICDNSLQNNYLLFQVVPRCKYVFWGKNLGLSKAFNIVLSDLEYGFQEDDYIIYFDQDSRISSGHINRLVEKYEKIESFGYKIGCIGPAFYNNINKQIEIPKMKKKLDEHVYEVSSIITSSMLCKYGSLKSINFWNEDIFLDMADWDLCWRFIEAGKKCCMTDIVVLNHSVGVGEKKIGLIRLRVGQPIREYYQTRDCLKLILKKYTPLKFKMRFILQVTLRPLLHICFLNDPRERMRYIVWGYRDFIKQNDTVLPNS